MSTLAQEQRAAPGCTHHQTVGGSQFCLLDLLPSMSGMPFGEIVFLDELAARPAPEGLSLRLTGRLTGIYTPDYRGWLRDVGHTALLDVSLCTSASALEGRLVQAIGEVVSLPADSVPPRLQPPVVALRARVVRDVEGIDVALYRRAIMIRRKALAGVREAGKEGLPTFHVP